MVFVYLLKKLVIDGLFRAGKVKRGEEVGVVHKGDGVSVVQKGDGACVVQNMVRK